MSHAGMACPLFSFKAEKTAVPPFATIVVSGNMLPPTDGEQPGGLIASSAAKVAVALTPVIIAKTAKIIRTELALCNFPSTIIRTPPEFSYAN